MIGQRIRGGALRTLSWVVCRLPERPLIAVADLVGDLWYRLTPERRALGRDNLRRVVTALAAEGRGGPSITAAAASASGLERLVRRTYRHAARYYLELIRAPAMNPAFIDRRLVVETPEVVDAAFEPGTPVIFVGLHFGAIELPALYLTHRSGKPATGPMETLSDPALQAWIVRSRGAAGVNLVDIRVARRELAAAIERGESVGLVADRDLLGTGLELRFFGATARFPIGPVLLAIQSGAPIYVASVRRSDSGQYFGRLSATPIPAEGTLRERVAAGMVGIVAAFEETIERAPEQWWGAFFPIWTEPRVAP